VRFKQAQDFVRRGHFLPFEHARAGLGDDPFDQRHDLLGLLSLALASQESVQRLNRSPRAAQVAAARGSGVVELPGDQGLGALHQPGEHPHTLNEQPTVGRMMDGGLHTGG
jgi:hypothetical protein